MKFDWNSVDGTFISVLNVISKDKKCKDET